MLLENDSMPIYLFHQGTNHEAYKLMCPRYVEADGKAGWLFHVWAPKAESVSVVGDFNGWDMNAHKMNKISVGIWEAFICEAREYDRYKFAVTTKFGKTVLKADPYAVHSETPPQNASRLYTMRYNWNDEEWIKKREKYNPHNHPMNIYEINAGSWRRYPDGNYYNYRKLAEELIPYLVDMNYTHVELMPLTEFPFTGSWGYQCTGMYAPTSRYGTPDDLAYFVDECHKAGIGVFMDWVPAHFPKDEFGLCRFDGEPLYEYADPKKGEHPDWGTLVYDYGRNEVRSFLISSAHYWVDKFHMDGIRVDAVSSMLYLDYGRGHGQWIPNIYGGNINLEAVSFLQELNSSIMTRFYGVQMIAEESTSYAGVTKAPSMGGLGFTFKWNMGWMNDTLRYIKTDPVYRQAVHNNMTFSLVYAFNENYILALSHDEVVHCKGSLINKQQGNYDEKFASLKTYLAYQIGHPGKKLIFMGGEFGQFNEWNENKGLDWNLLEYPKHSGLLRYVKDLNALYKYNPAMFERDTDYSGFKWLSVNDNKRNILSFMRIGNNGNYVFNILNFSPVFRRGFMLGVPEKCDYRVIIDNFDDIYGGDYPLANGRIVHAEDGGVDGEPYHITFDLKGYNAIYFEPVRVQEKTRIEEVKPTSEEKVDEVKLEAKVEDVKVKTEVKAESKKKDVSAKPKTANPTTKKVETSKNKKSAK